MTNEELVEEVRLLRERITKLEKDSHPPIDLEPAIKEILTKALTGKR